MDNPKSAPARKYTLKTAHPSPEAKAKAAWIQAEREVEAAKAKAFEAFKTYKATRLRAETAEAIAWTEVHRLAKMEVGS